jgi:hypothetical protein
MTPPRVAIGGIRAGRWIPNRDWDVSLRDGLPTSGLGPSYRRRKSPEISYRYQ